MKNIISDSGCHQKTNGSDVPICNFIRRCRFERGLCGLCRRVKETGKKLTTFSFDFIDNDKYFKANSFQPSQDRPYVDKWFLFWIPTITISNVTTKCRRIYYTAQWTHMTSPCMADIDSSLQYFARKSAILIKGCTDRRMCRRGIRRIPMVSQRGNA